VTARGSVVAEALVAAALAGVASAALVGTVVSARSAVVAARDASTAVALAESRLEALRAGPRAAGADAPAGNDGTVFARSWAVGGGRGLPVTLAVDVAWRGRVVSLATDVWP
jgi:type II secretory pathway pseudopilin PulG